MFIGTPHRGSSDMALNSVVTNILSLALNRPDDKILRVFKQDSDILERQRRSFATISNEMSLVCLYEELPLHGHLVSQLLFTSISASNRSTESLKFRCHNGLLVTDLIQ